jgi:hypothetical protein
MAGRNNSNYERDVRAAEQGANNDDPPYAPYTPPPPPAEVAAAGGGGGAAAAGGGGGEVAPTAPRANIPKIEALMALVQGLREDAGKKIGGDEHAADPEYRSPDLFPAIRDEIEGVLIPKNAPKPVGGAAPGTRAWAMTPADRALWLNSPVPTEEDTGAPEVGSHNLSLVQAAIVYGHFDIALYLLKFPEVDFTQLDQIGMSLLQLFAEGIDHHMTAETDDTNTTKHFMELFYSLLESVDVNHRGTKYPSDITVLEALLVSPIAEVDILSDTITELIKRSSPEALNYQKEGHQNALALVCKQYRESDFMEWMTTLHEQGADFKQRIYGLKVSKEWTTLYHLAIYLRNKTLFTLVQKSGLDINSPDDAGVTPVQFAALQISQQKSSDRAVKVISFLLRLVDLGADISQPIPPTTRYIDEYLFGHPYYLLELIKRRSNIASNPALFMSAFQNPLFMTSPEKREEFQKVIHAVLEKGEIDLKYVGPDGGPKTFLMAGINLWNRELIDACLAIPDYDVNAETAPGTGLTAIAAIARATPTTPGIEEVLEKLLERGANPMILIKYIPQMPPLYPIHYAAMNDPGDPSDTMSFSSVFAILLQRITRKEDADDILIRMLDARKYFRKLGTYVELLSEFIYRKHNYKIDAAVVKKFIDEDAREQFLYTIYYLLDHADSLDFKVQIPGHAEHSVFAFFVYYPYPLHTHTRIHTNILRLLTERIPLDVGNQIFYILAKLIVGDGEISDEDAKAWVAHAITPTRNDETIEEIVWQFSDKLVKLTHEIFEQWRHLRLDIHLKKEKYSKLLAQLTANMDKRSEFVEEAKRFVREHIKGGAGRFKRPTYNALLEIIPAIDAAASKGEPWLGSAQSDMDKYDRFLQTIIDAEKAKRYAAAHPGEARPRVDLVSFCPVCLKYVQREEGCMYMHHDCRELGGFYHRELYEKFKYAIQYPDGTVKDEIAWCIYCGRIAGASAGASHQHYAHSDPADAAKPPMLPLMVSEGSSIFFDSNCISNGGGGLAENLKRIRRLREYALDLERRVGKISDYEARRRLVEEMWLAGRARSEYADEMLESMEGASNAALAGGDAVTWNIPLTRFPTNANWRARARALMPAPAAEEGGGAAGEEATEAAAPDVPLPATSTRIRHPVEDGLSCAICGEQKEVYHFQHEQPSAAAAAGGAGGGGGAGAAGGRSLNRHEGEYICADDLTAMIQSRTGGFAVDPGFGKCWMYSRCQATFYPGDIKDIVPDDVYKKYTLHFNQRWLEGKIQAGGRRGRRRGHKTRRAKKQNQKGGGPQQTRPVLQEATDVKESSCDVTYGGRRNRKTRRVRRSRPRKQTRQRR